MLCKIHIPGGAQELQDLNINKIPVKEKGGDVFYLYSSILNYIDTNFNIYDTRKPEDTNKLFNQTQNFNQIQYFLNFTTQSFSSLGYFDLADKFHVFSKDFERKFIWRSKYQKKWSEVICIFFKYPFICLWKLLSDYGVSVYRLIWCALGLWFSFGLFYTFITPTNSFHATVVTHHDKVYCNIETSSVKSCEDYSYHPLTYDPNYFKSIHKHNLYVCDADIINIKDKVNFKCEPAKKNDDLISYSCNNSATKSTNDKPQNTSEDDLNCYSPDKFSERSLLYYFYKFGWALSYSAAVFTTFSFGDVYPLNWLTITAMIVQIFLGCIMIGITIAVLIRKVSPRF